MSQTKSTKAPIKNHFTGEYMLSNPSFWNFSQNPDFVGRFTGNKQVDEKNQIQGFEAISNDGIICIIGASEIISRAYEKMFDIADFKGYLAYEVKISFKGKVPTKTAGQTVNLYDVRCKEDLPV